MAADLERARAAKERLVARLAGQESVVGIGVQRAGEGFGVKVNLREAGLDIPAEVDGVPVSVDVVGTIRPQAT